MFSGQPTILIVESSDSILDLLKKILSRQGYFTKSAKTFKSAQKILCDLKPDLILLSTILPDIDGIKLLMEFKKLPACQNVPVIFIGGENEIVTREAVFEAGAADFIYQPYLPREILTKVEIHLDLNLKNSKINDAEDRFNHLFDKTGIGVWEYNLQTGDIFSTVNTERILGYDEGHILEKGDYKWRKLKDSSKSYAKKYVHPKDLKSYMRIIMRLMKGEVFEFQMEYRLLDNSGTYRWFLDIGRVLKWDTEKKPILASGLLIDINEHRKYKSELETAQKATDKALKQVEAKEQQYISLVDNIPGVVYRCDFDEHYTMQYISDYVKLLTGYPPQDFVNNKVRSFASVIYPDDLSKVEQTVNEAISSNGLFTIEYRIIDKKGEVHFVFEKGQAVSDKDGNVEYLDGIIMDTSQRKQTEDILKTAKESLEYSEARQSAILNNMVDAVITINQKGIIQQFSNTAEKMFGYSAEEVRGKNVKILQPEDVASEHDKYLLQYAKTRQANIIGIGREVLARKKDRTLFPADLAVAAFEFHGELIFVGVMRDITERKRLEENIIRAKEQADAANRTKSLFLANMSHEIRTPMNAILGHSQIMKRDNTLTQKQQKSIESIIKGGEHLLALINDILDMSKIEAGEVKLVRSSFLLTNLVKEIEEMFYFRIEQKRLSYELNLDPTFPEMVRSDEHRIRQVLINLVGNAIKFTDDGGIVINGLMADGLVQLTITDSGCGIPNDQFEEIFKSFVQSDLGMSNTIGTGLGLAISRKLARLMGGDISVESIVGKGSSFTLKFKFEEGDKREIELNLSDRTVKKLEDGQPEIRVLVVDDKEDNRTIIRLLLEPKGFVIQEAENGLEAIEICKKWNPRIILMDMVMPVMSGRDAIEKLRSTDDYKDIPIIAISASAFDDEREDILKMGVEAFIKKPFRDKELLEEIRHHARIEYIYDNMEDKDVNIDLSNLDQRKIMEIPQKLRDDIVRATETGHLALLNDLITEIAAFDQDIANLFEILVNDFELETIQNLLKNNGGAHAAKT